MLSDQPAVHRDGLRASDKGFLDRKAYWQLVCWTADHTVGKVTQELPAHLAKCLAKFGIDLSQRADSIQNNRCQAQMLIRAWHQPTLVNVMGNEHAILLTARTSRVGS